MKIRILADDLTGALDTTAAFAGDVPVWLDRPGPKGDDDDAAVSVVATPTRDVDRDELEPLLAPSLAWLRAADVSFKKVDSLLRGNTFAECALAGREAARIVFAPAYPAQGRITVDGYAWRRQPGSDADQRIVDAPLARRVSDELARWSSQGMTDVRVPDVWVPDVRTDADLDVIAAQALHASARDWLWCGSAGLAHALARTLGLAASPEATAQAASPRDEAVGSEVLLASATRNPVLLRQWSLLESTLRTKAGATFAGDSKTFRAGRIAGTHLAASEPMTQPLAAAYLARRTQALVANGAKPGMLVVIGGDTLLALCRAAGTRSLLARASPREGWGMATLVGGHWDGVTCLSRSGAFGGDDDLVELLRRWFG